MGYDNVFGINNKRPHEDAGGGSVARVVGTISRQFTRMLCSLHGHVIMLHFEPNKLSLECSLCGYQTEGWEVGRPMTARRQANNPYARPERRRTLRPLPTPTKARLAS
jgi:hypothetical protein